RVACAQVVLVGCTGFVSSNPQPSALVDINLSTGTASNPRALGISVMGGIAAQPATGTLFGLTTFASMPGNALLRIDPQTGAVTTIGPTGLSQIIEGDLAFNPVNGFLYGLQAVGATNLNLFRLDLQTGNGTIVGSVASSGDFSALAFN